MCIFQVQKDNCFKNICPQKKMDHGIIDHGSWNIYRSWNIGPWNYGIWNFETWKMELWNMEFEVVPKYPFVGIATLGPD